MKPTPGVKSTMANFPKIPKKILSGQKLSDTAVVLSGVELKSQQQQLPSTSGGSRRETVLHQRFSPLKPKRSPAKSKKTPPKNSRRISNGTSIGQQTFFQRNLPVSATNGLDFMVTDQISGSAVSSASPSSMVSEPEIMLPTVTDKALRIAFDSFRTPSLFLDENLDAAVDVDLLEEDIALQSKMAAAKDRLTHDMEELDLLFLSPPYIPADLPGQLLMPLTDFRLDKNYPYLTPERAIEVYGRDGSGTLTEYEEGEILQYPHIFTVGFGAVGKTVRTVDSTNNHGMDGRDGRYRGNDGDHIAYRYQITKYMGQGNSSHVVAAYDHQERRDVALKIFRNRKRFNHMGREELALIRKLDASDPGNDHNILRLYHAFYFRRHLVFVTELLESDLLRFISQMKDSRDEPKRVVQRQEMCDFISSTLKALAFLDANNLVHLDVKPENLMLKDARKLGSVRLVDFGSARQHRYPDQQDYIQTRYYRAPEVLMTQRDLDSKVDMWSFGCVVAELHTQNVLFEGERELQMVALITEMLDVPGRNLIQKWYESHRLRGAHENDEFRRRFSTYFCKTGGGDGPWTPYYIAKRLTNNEVEIGLPGSKKLEDVLFLQSHSRLTSFISACLKWNPEERMSPRQGLEHEVLTTP